MAPKVMLDIAACESHTQQFDNKGKVVIGPTKDIGVFQISPLWIPTAKKMDLDVYKTEDNIAFALWLYNKEGTRPWKSSEHCWNSSGDD